MRKHLLIYLRLKTKVRFHNFARKRARDNVAWVSRPRGKHLLTHCLLFSSNIRFCAENTLSHASAKTEGENNKRAAQGAVKYSIASSSALIRLEMQFLYVKGLLARSSNSLSLNNTFCWTIANLNFTQSKYCTIIFKMVKFQRNRMCGKFHIRIQFFVHSKSLLFVLITMTGSTIA